MMNHVRAALRVTIAATVLVVASVHAAPPSDLDRYVKRVFDTFETPGFAITIVERGKAPVVSALPGNLTTGGKLLSSNIAYFAPVKDVKLPKPAIKTTVKAVGNDIAIGLTSATLVKNLCLSHEAEGRFSDNYFDMLPNASVIVRFTPAKPMTVKAFEAGLSTMHMAEIQG